MNKLLSGGSGGRGRSFVGIPSSTPVYSGTMDPPPPSPVGLPDNSLYFKYYNQLGNVRFYNGVFIATEGNHVFSSTDALSWTMRIEHAGITAIAAGNGYYVAVGADGFVAYSADAITWTIDLTFPGVDDNGIADVCFSSADNLFYMCVNQGMYIEVYSYDPAGPTFVMVHDINSTEPDTVHAIGASYYCLSPNPSANPRVEVLGKYDDGAGSTGRLRTYMDDAGNWNDEYDTAQLPAIANLPKKICQWQWPNVAPPNGPHYGFDTVYENGYVRLQHANTYSWSSGITSDTVESLFDVVCRASDGNLVVVGNNGKICSGLVTGTVGQALTARVSGTTQNLRGVCWNGANFVATGNGLDVLFSADGVTWTKSVAVII